MPFKSKAQNAWAHTAAGKKALGGDKKVKEWEKSTDYDNLPERASDKPAPKPSRIRRTTRPR